MTGENGTEHAQAPPPELDWNPGLGERIRWIWEFWRPHRGFVAVLLVLTLVSSGVAIAYPLVFKFVLDQLAAAMGDTAAGVPAEGTPRVDPDTLRSILGILGVIALGRALARLYPGFRAWVNLKLDVAIRRKVFKSILQKDYSFFHRFRTGDLVTRLMDDIIEYPKLAWFSCSGIFRALESGSKLIFCVAAMFALAPELSLVAVAPLPIMLTIIYGLRSRQRQAYEDQQKAISQTNDMLEATFSGIRIVKAFCAEKNQARALDRILDSRIGVQFRVQKLYALVQVLDTVASRIGQLVVIGYGGWLVVHGQITLGTLYAVYIYLDMLVEPMVDLPNLVVTSRQAFVCMDREEEVLRYPDVAESRRQAFLPIEHTAASKAGNGSDREVEPPNHGTPEDAPSSPGSAQPLHIELHGIGLTYAGSSESALEGVDLDLAPGERMAVVGEVASGKSTLLKLLAGLLPPTQGHLEIDGCPSERLDWAEVRARIGYAPQESLLFSESIRDNVEMGRADGLDPLARRNRLQHLLELVHMDEEVARMPAGLDTVLGQKGTRVSGGQRQRLAIARALYGAPQLVLLDDVTASLDAENEDRLWARLDRWLPGATLVVVSHRHATIQRADRIVVLESGRVAGVGTHEELRERCPEYRRFLEREQERERVGAE